MLQTRRQRKWSQIGIKGPYATFKSLPLGAYLCHLGPVTQRFHRLSKQCHCLGNKGSQWEPVRAILDSDHNNVLTKGMAEIGTRGGFPTQSDFF